jgi:hypothetical protein
MNRKSLRVESLSSGNILNSSILQNSSRRVLQPIAILAIVIASLASLAVASTKSTADCTVAGVQAIAPPNVTIGLIPDGNLPYMISQAEVTAGGGVVAVPANSQTGTPAFCFVQGSLLTNPGVSTSKANFQMSLPAIWNNRFLFTGCMVLCGVVTVPRYNLGYAAATTDDGHVANTALGGPYDASWALNSDGTPNTDALTDYYYRAVHKVSMATRSLAVAFYSRHVVHSYYEGCSDGGREGMVEVSRFPADFDGVIAGDPFFDIAGQTMNAYSVAKVQLRANDAPVIPKSLLHILDAAIHQQCDTADGVADGLIQDPALCDYNPKTSLPICSPTVTTNCFTRNQADAVAAWFTAIHNPEGTFTYPAYPLADVDDVAGRNLGLFATPKNGLPPMSITAPQPWGLDTEAPGAWAHSDNVLRYMVFQDVDFDSNSGPGMTYTVTGTEIQNTLPDSTIDLMKEKTVAGRGDDPQAALPFLGDGKKLIMYHGFSDGLITPYQTMRYYKALSTLAGGYPALQENARLFMVPGMFHCGGGPGPNVFDMLTALQDWVELGVAPDAIVATNGTQKDKKGNLRSMPLCKFPEMATYDGAGDVRDSASWSCVQEDQRLLLNGPNGVRAGLK